MEKETNNHEFQANAALYALGALSLDETQAFEKELQESEKSAQIEVAAFTEVVTHLSATAPEATPSMGVREALLANIANDKSRSLLRPSTAANTETPTEINIFQSDEDWVRTYEGISIKKLYRDPVTNFTTRLVKLEPGAHLPAHKHLGSEQCFMISGDFVINGVTYREGDFTVALDQSSHLDLHSVGGATVLIISPPRMEML
jgi:anti-sigma factor ChrR (cupin superfamily)